uniref:Endonuclease/exonuclease/phosphatase domain-containing protein n=1 Tax=Latimeria chalumnae TaxID=7897 RepID=H3ANI7_LATCH
STSMMEQNNIEVLTVDMDNISITPVYKPPGECFAFMSPENLDHNKACMIIGDLNSHSITWGYSENDENGDLVEMWAEAYHLSLIHDSKLPGSFNSSRWRRSYNPHLAFVDSNIEVMCKKDVLEPIPHTQHRPIAISVTAAITPNLVPMHRRFNFKKADWRGFSEDLDKKVTYIDPTPENYDLFVNALRNTSKRYIPGGCRTEHIPGFTPVLAGKYKKYQQMFQRDLFSEDTIAAGTALTNKLQEERRRKWKELIKGIDMTHTSRKAWLTIRKLNNNLKKVEQHYNITANQVAHQLLLNRKASNKQPKILIRRQTDLEENHFSAPYTIDELNVGISHLKNGKAAGLDDICTEQIKHFGPATKLWVLRLFNNCSSTLRI